MVQNLRLGVWYGTVGVGVAVGLGRVGLELA